MRSAQVAALCCAVMAGSAAMPAHAQYYGPAHYGPPPPPMYYRPPPHPTVLGGVLGTLFAGIPNVVGRFGNAYGYRGGGAQSAYCPPGQQVSRPVRHEHPYNVAGQYRCFPDGRPSGGPGTGTGWCKHNR